MAWGQIISLMWRLPARIPLSRALRFSRRRITKPWSIKCALIWRPSLGVATTVTQAEFSARQTEGFNRIPVSRTVLADAETPLSAYAKLAQGRDPFSSNL